MRLLCRFVLFAVLSSAVTVGAATSDYYVSPTGNDTTGDGSQARPWKTIQKSADTMSAGDTCHVLDGEYTELVRPARSGAAGQYISFVADGSAAYVVGTRPITGWTVHSGSIWKANVTSDFDDLFVDRQRMVVARWPNLTTGDVYRPNFFQATANGGDASIIDAVHLTQASAYWDGAKIFMVPGLGWVADQRSVTGYDPGTHRLTFNPAISNAEWYDADQYSLYFLYDKLSLLDAPSEWFLDRTTHTVYVWLPDGSDPNAHLVESSGGSAGFDLTDRSYVRVSGVSVINGNISLVNATWCRIEGVRHLYPVIELKMSGSDNVITQCEIAYAGYTGVRIAGTRNTVSRCHIHHCDYLGATTAEYFGFDSLIQFGFKEDWPRIGETQNTVADCSLHGAGRDGVIAQSDISACVLEHNEIYNTGLIALDTGGFYMSTMDAGGTVLRYNIVHDIRPRELYQWGAPVSPGNGIYLDEASANFVVHHNLVYGVPSQGITLHQASRYNLVYNNTAVGSGGGWGDIINSTPGGRWFGVEGTEVANNLAVILDGRAGLDNSVPWCINFQSEIPAYHHNGYYNPLDSQKLHSQGLEATAVVGNPLFTNAAANDFSLQAGSPMIDKGVVIPGITDGFGGAAPDIGAYERGSSEVPGLRYAVGPPAPAPKDHYVSPSGNDTTGDGSQGRPWKTIQRAADAMAPGDTCHVQDGDYPEMIKPARSGTIGQYLSFVADGASVTLSGTRAITGWAVHSGNIWKATVTTDFDDLFVDRQRMVVARWPNLASGDAYRPTFYQATANGGDTSIIDATHFSEPSGYWDGARVFMVPGLGWVADQRSVTGYDPGTHQLTFSPAISFADYYDADQYTQYFLYDKLSLLDAPSEWFLDRTTHTVYVWLPDGSDPNGHLVEASGGPAGFDLTNRSYVRVTGFKILNGDIRLLRATGCVVENVWHLYPTAELLVSGSDNVITRSEIAYTNYAGVRLTGTRNTLSKSAVHHCNYYGSGNAIVEFGNNNFWPNGGSENAIIDCSLHDSGRDGVTLVSSTDLSVRTLLVEHNEIYNTGLVTRRSDGFYNWNRDAGGTVVRYNIIHDIWPMATPQYGGIAVGNGINLADNSSNFAVHHNVLYRVPATVISLRLASTNNLVYNNTAVGSGGGWGDLVNSSPGSIGSGVAGTEVANNLAVNLDGRWAWGINFQSVAPVYHHNGYYNPSTDTRNNSQGVEATGVVANPLFMDAAGNDFSLTATSPMIDTGAVVAGITDGYLGAAPDIGAYEREASERPGLRYVAPWLVFTDDPLVARVTPIKAIHVAELRVAIDRLRQAHGLSPHARTDPTLSRGITAVKAEHLAALRAALNAVYVAMGRTPPTYADTLTPGTTIITAAHLAEMRAAVRAIW